ncbi:MAG: ATP-dependent helicase, partial [Candidatus Dormibacteraeota bacterium]|nr:ATP-dependent helicase [Candidatus Dormibacteraeota bacterium]
GQPLLHRSIFECLRAPESSGDWTAMLLENWRMNQTLCRYPAEQVYVPEYRSATNEVARRRLALTAAGNGAERADALLDPEHPLVVGVLEGVRAAAENRIEADLVAGAACRLRERLVDAADDVDFWRRRLFIVSPHHAQIHAIRRALRARRDWRASPFVDTVDRMQGQECDAVIASYGVSDVEYAMQEAGFIYSLNRLNVSITRARAKTIVFLPRPLIEPPIAAYEDETIAEGVAFMQGLVRFAEQHGERSEHRLKSGDGRLVLLRVPDFP